MLPSKERQKEIIVILLEEVPSGDLTEEEISWVLEYLTDRMVQLELREVFQD